MRRTITALLAVALVGIAAPAYADTDQFTGGSVGVKDDNLADDLCVDIPVLISTADMPSDYSWVLDLDTDASNGVYAYGDGIDVQLKTALWCPGDLTGVFSLYGTLTVHDGDYNLVATDFIDIDFTVRKQTSAATIRTPDKTPKVGKVFHLKGCVTSTGKRDDYRDIAVQYKRPGGGWKLLDEDMTDEVGCYDVETFMKTKGTAWLRVHVPSTHSRLGTYSPELKIVAHK